MSSHTTSTRADRAIAIAARTGDGLDLLRSSRWGAHGIELAKRGRTHFSFSEDDYVRRFEVSELVTAAAACVIVGCGPPKASDPMVVPPEEASAVETGSGEEPSPAPADAEPGAETAQDAGGEMSEDAVSSFARAYFRVITIEQTYGPKLQAAQTPDEVESIKVEATQEMQQAVTDEGMTVDEFEQIGQRVAADEALRERVETELQELQTSTAP
jgi:hypothetical protein